MNPLQKKCIIATAGFHLLLLLILFVGPGFFRQPPPQDTLPVLKVIPLNAIEAALTSGGAAAATPPPVAQPQPPPPAEPVTPTPPTPEPPKTVVTPPVEPKSVEVKPVEAKPVEREPDPTPVVSKPVETEKPDDVPTPLPKPEPHKIDIDLTPVVHKTTKIKHHDDSQAKAAAAKAEAAEEAREERAERAAARERASAISRITTGMQHGLSQNTEVNTSFESGAATANYGQIVKSIYFNAWNLPDSASTSDASPKARVVIARDGTVISAHIIQRSGDSAVDDSVQRALDRVTFIKPFAESATENERPFTIVFDAQTKRSE